MTINLEKDKTYPLSKNYNNTERRKTETQPQAPSKKTMDNSAATMYNKVKENNTIKQPTALRDFASQWKQKNQGALKYAGDLAKKSINAGLEEAKTFMKDADEGTSFEKVQDASVKWKLAQDSNNPKLLKNAQNEMIGHLSRENKDTYLKDAQPLQTYVDAKDEFDYKNNSYTTTQSIDTTPDENVRNLQKELNQKGYTDKFGEKLKEDGIYGGKTAYALDELEKSSNNSNNNKYKTAIINGNEYQVEYPIATKEDLQPKMLDDNEIELYTENNDIQLLVNKNSYEYNKKVKESAKTNGKSEKKIKKASDAILRNATNIKNAAKKHGVNPAILASCIYTEQVLNVNFIDTATDNIFYWADTSVGIGQVKISTAKLLEDKGYIAKIPYAGKRRDWRGNSYTMTDSWDVPGYGIVVGPREYAIAVRLGVEEQCIEYAAAYLKYWQDRWKHAYPEIDGRSAILGTLYNLGKKAKEPNPNPKPNDFGSSVKGNYYYMQYLLDLE